jgi:hypothetical protein
MELDLPEPCMRLHSKGRLLLQHSLPLSNSMKITEITHRDTVHLKHVNFGPSADVEPMSNDPAHACLLSAFVFYDLNDANESQTKQFNIEWCNSDAITL